MWPAGLRTRRHTIALLLALSITASARAAVFTVNTTSDGVDAAPGDGTCATADGLCTLRAAVQEANAIRGTDSIRLPGGTFLLTIDGDKEDDAATGDIDIRESVDIKGSGRDDDPTTVRAIAKDRVFDVIQGDVVITDLGITGGNDFEYSGGTSFTGNGGGIYVRSGSLTLRRCRVESNTALGPGGGIDNRGDLTIESSTVTGNNSIEAFGGGIFDAGFARIDKSRIRGNRAAMTGGGIEAEGGFVTISQSEISGNEAGGGGGIAGGHIEIDASLIADNTAEGGGGVAIRSGHLRNSTISGNHARTQGGGIYVGAYDDGVFGNNVTVVGNEATSGGGVFVDGGLPVLRLLNSIIAENTATVDSPDCSGRMLIQTDLIEHVEGCTLVGDATGTIVGVAPGLGPLQPNGGPTQTYAVLDGSPARDAGTSNFAIGSCEDRDQRGVYRPFTHCDVGAYQSSPCGDGIVDAPDEQCDRGAANGTPGASCSANCSTVPRGADCGDGHVDADEECDEGPDDGQPGTCCAKDCKLLPIGATCRVAQACVQAAVCSGTSDACPPDSPSPDGTTCDNGDRCGPDSCHEGACVSPATCATTGVSQSTRHPRSIIVECGGRTSGRKQSVFCAARAYVRMPTGKLMPVTPGIRSMFGPGRRARLELRLSRRGRNLLRAARPAPLPVIVRLRTPGRRTEAVDVDVALRSS